LTSRWIAMGEERESPFSNGSQYCDWICCNCDRCAKKGRCDIEGALHEGAVNYGDVPCEIAARMGYYDNEMAFVWMCPEVEWTEAWLLESARRRTLRFRAGKWLRRRRYYVSTQAKRPFKSLLIALDLYEPRRRREAEPDDPWRQID